MAPRRCLSSPRPVRALSHEPPRAVRPPAPPPPPKKQCKHAILHAPMELQVRDDNAQRKDGAQQKRPLQRQPRARRPCPPAAHHGRWRNAKPAAPPQPGCKGGTCSAHWLNTGEHSAAAGFWGGRRARTPPPSRPVSYLRRWTTDGRHHYLMRSCRAEREPVGGGPPHPHPRASVFSPCSPRPTRHCPPSYTIPFIPTPVSSPDLPGAAAQTTWPPRREEPAAAARGARAA